MAYLYLTEQGSILRKAGDRLLVERRRSAAWTCRITSSKRCCCLGTCK